MQTETDIPSPIDFRDMSDARAWADSAMVKRPWRDRFFARITSEIAGLPAAEPSVLELGSGPGFMAQRVLETVPGVAYFALDFSRAMHRLAKDRLGPVSDRVSFLERDFKSPDWHVDLPRFDVALTVQAVHELRHKRYAAAFFRTVRSLLKPSGVFLVCDHFVGEGGMENRSLYMTPAEHDAALRAGRFMSVDLLLQERGLILFRAYGRAA